MKYLKQFQIFESKSDLIDTYLSKLGTTKQDVIDIFQGIIDLGYEPKFTLQYIDKDGRKRDEKSTSQETPIVIIDFVSNHEKYIGGSIKFNNLDYIENLYHNLSMFMSMFKDKCHITYELDNMIELKLKLQFETEYDQSKLNISITDLQSALESSMSLVPNEYLSEIVDELLLVIKPQSSLVGKRLFNEIIKTKEDRISNKDELYEISKNINQSIAKKLSDKFKKDIRYEVVKGSYFDKKGTGLYLFEGNEKEMICRIQNLFNEHKKYDGNIKTGFLKTKEVSVDLEYLEIKLSMT